MMGQYFTQMLRLQKIAHLIIQESRDWISLNEAKSSWRDSEDESSHLARPSSRADLQRHSFASVATVGINYSASSEGIGAIHRPVSRSVSAKSSLLLSNGSPVIDSGFMVVASQQPVYYVPITTPYYSSRSSLILQQDLSPPMDEIFPGNNNVGYKLNNEARRSIRMDNRPTPPMRNDDPSEIRPTTPLNLMDIYPATSLKREDRMDNSLTAAFKNDRENQLTLPRNEDQKSTGDSSEVRFNDYMERVLHTWGSENP
ncbi:hypothetical protein HK096_000235 [Nowakowskiella sp. JEL0078]|nr:hypothetical protein HK096_000235 [Nowakowskiella sp. JEL0078]